MQDATDHTPIVDPARARLVLRKVRLDRRLPVLSSIIASQPLPRHLARCLLAKGQVLYEAGRITTYYRVDSDNRLIMGGRGIMREAEGAEHFAGLRRYAESLWPALRGIRWEYGWNGRLAVTRDHYPHIHDLQDGRLICLGYNGRGVAVGSAIGAQLARRLIDATALLDLPIIPIKPIALQPLWKIGSVPFIFWNRLLDRLGH